MLVRALADISLPTHSTCNRRLPVTESDSLREEKLRQCSTDVPNPAVTNETTVDSEPGDTGSTTDRCGSPYAVNQSKAVQHQAVQSLMVVITVTVNVNQVKPL